MDPAKSSKDEKKPEPLAHPNNKLPGDKLKTEGENLLKNKTAVTQKKPTAKAPIAKAPIAKAPIAEASQIHQHIDGMLIMTSHGPHLLYFESLILIWVSDLTLISLDDRDSCHKYQSQ